MKLKLENPELEQRLLAGLRRSSATPMSQGEGFSLGPLKAFFMAVALEAMLIFILINLLGWKHAAWARPGVQVLTVGFWFLMSASLVRGSLERESFQSVESMVLWTLPVPGRWILQRAIVRAVLQTWRILLRAVIACWALSGFPEPFLLSLRESLAIVVPGLALWIVTLATAGAERHAWLLLLRLPQLWLGLRVLGGLAFVGMYLTSEKRLRWLPVQAYLESCSSTLVWLMPPSWVAAWMHGGAVGSGPAFALLATMVTLLGLRVWQRWPDQAAPVFDSLHPDEDPGGADEEHAGEWSDVAWHEQGLPPRTAAPLEDQALPTTTEVTRALRAADKCPWAASGWIERWFWSVLSRRDRAVLPVLVRNPPTWSARWWLACKWLGGLLVLALLCQVILKLTDRAQEQVEMVRVFSFVGMGITVLLMATPITNGVSDALWPTPGGQGSRPFPMLATLPVKAWDLLRVSQKLIAVRSVAAFAVALPAVLVLGYLVDRMHGVLVACDVLLRVLALLFLIRPFLVIYRLQENTQGTRKGWWIRLSVMVILTGLFAVWSIMAAAFAMFAFPADSTMARVLSWSLALPMYGLGMLAFWLYRRLLRAQCLDYSVKI